MSESNTVFYIIVFIVIAHFIIGFYFLVKKLSAKPKENRDDQNLNEGTETHTKE